MTLSILVANLKLNREVNNANKSKAKLNEIFFGIISELFLLSLSLSLTSNT